MTTNIIQKAAAKNAVAKRENNGLASMLKQMAPAIKAALPAVITPERFTRIVTSALSTNPVLSQTTPRSFLGAMMTAAQLGVEPNTPLGQAYLIPYKNHGQLECQFQLGYKGLIDLAYRSGEIASIQAHEVRERDLFEYEFGLDPKLKHVPAMKDRGAVTHYYSVFITKAGGKGFAVMSKDEVMEFATKYSKAYARGASPWQSHFDEMAKKTVLKQCLKYAPLKSEFVRGLVQDETVKTEIDADMSIVPPVEVEPIEVDTVEPDPAEESPEVDNPKASSDNL